jgi:hypothetical protein
MGCDVNDELGAPRATSEGSVLGEMARDEDLDLCHVATCQALKHSLTLLLIYRHTSLVLFGMEVFYGQGIDIVSPPGTTHVCPSSSLNVLY